MYFHIYWCPQLIYNPFSFVLQRAPQKFPESQLKRAQKSSGQILALCSYFCAHPTKFYFPNILVPCQKCQGSLTAAIVIVLRV